jgi:hypothetical protein
MKASFSWFLLVGISVLSSQAHAENGVDASNSFFKPRLEGYLFIDLTNDYIFDDDHKEDRNDDDTDINELSSAIELDLDLYLADPFFINVNSTLFGYFDVEVGTDRNQRDIDFFVDDLTVNWMEENWSLIGGKFIPNFSLASDDAPGLYGSELAEDDIELSNRIGIGGDLSYFSRDFGWHRVSGSAFFIDTTFLSGSFVRSMPLESDPDGVQKSDGGAGNTKTLDSFAVAIDGSDISALPGLSYHVGGVRQGVDNVRDEDDRDLPNDEIKPEYRLAVAGEWEVAVAEDTIVTSLVEYVRFWNADGVESEERDYFTTSAAVDYQNWTTAISSTVRLTEEPDNSRDTDFLFQVSAGYTFDSGFGTEIGYRLFNEDDIAEHTMGIYFFYEIGFAM